MIEIEITKVDQEKALTTTADLLVKLGKIAADTGVSIALTYEAYSRNEEIAAREREATAKREYEAANTCRMPMPIRSKAGDFTFDKKERSSLGSSRCPIGKRVSVTTRPQVAAYRIEDIQITRNPERWVVHDITIGNRSALVQDGSIGGAAFGKDGIMRGARLRTAQVAMDVVMYVEYIGDDPEGEAFEAVAMGTAFERG